MKKQFFYAAMAVALMASCTSEENLVVDPENPTPEEDKVALNLGVATPAMTVGSRGTGMVGYVGTYDDKSSWDSQQLFVSMVDNKTNLIYEEPDGTPYFENVTFRAPKAGNADNNNGLIRIYNTYSETEDNGILEYKYYPVTGNYTFYGWHVDDAYDTTTSTLPELNTTAHTSETQKDGTATVTGIIINGSQDVLAAKTLAIPENMGSGLADNPYYTFAQAFQTNGGTYADMYAAQFSAKTARNGFTPILNFKHTLARLQFFVRSGKGSDAAKNYLKEDVDAQGNGLGTYTAKKRDDYQINANNWKEDEDEDNYTGDDDHTLLTGMLDGAMYVTGIKLLNVYDNIELDLIAQTAKIKENSSKATNGFDLMSTPDQAELTNTKALQPLVAVAPEYVWGFNTIPEGGTEVVNNANGTMATPIGESIMYLPVEEQDTEGNEIGTDQIIKLQVQLGQCLIKTEDETKAEGAADKYTYYWDQPKPVTLSLDASNLTVPNGPDGQPLSKEFAAGRSYNVYITIYGRERIEVSAQLVPWVEGGNITGDIEDDYVTE